jgi:hypothetical protein
VLSIQLIVDIHVLINNMIRFVAYRDHPPEDETYIIISNPENLTNATTILYISENWILSKFNVKYIS